ncbi:nitrile hydratase subunit beta [Acidimangrovimonas sediminis]|uniref:nitrile hydratase subunit beta n=1 Tax=Acidimangrovimonas sediminis TaxID=2056283 RepID=UPI000C80BED8|nr:nitrile hydratase subunit beta [Acidimangrovimonas sediminis]
MTRVHDMGGRYGDGAVDPAPDEPMFHAPWHRRAMALTLAAGAIGRWNIDAMRHAREAVAPQDYARFSYYEKWLAGVADMAVGRGMVTRAELAAAGDAAIGDQAGGEAGGEAGTAPPEFGPADPRALRPADVETILRRGSPSTRPGAAPTFTPGDRVRTRLPARNLAVDGGHTRLPAYAAGHLGRVLRHHGAHVLPDSNAHFLGEAPEPLYAVAFDAAEIWGSAERAGDEVVLDLWESYLVPAEHSE